MYETCVSDVFILLYPNSTFVVRYIEYIRIEKQMIGSIFSFCTSENPHLNTTVVLCNL